MRNIKTFLFCLFVSVPSFADETLLDRLVVEINSVSYTQRQIELFDAVFRTISIEETQQYIELNQATWKKTLDEFINFMLIEQEAHRLGSYLPSSSMIERALEVFNKGKGRYEGLHATLVRLQADERSIRQAIISVLRVASFLRSKKRRTVNTQSSNAAQWLEFGSEDWFAQLKQRAIVRYMAGGRDWKRIRSF